MLCIKLFLFCYLITFSSVFRAAMKMANIDHCFDYMFTNPKDSQGVSVLHLIHTVLKLWLQNADPHKHIDQINSLILCRNPGWRTTRASFCTLATSVPGPVVFQSTSCGGNAGTLKALGWRWEGRAISNWRISTQRPASCLSLTMVCW